MTGEPESAPSVVSFHYLKSQQFRVVHADGAIGGLTPSGLLHCALYSERPAIPRRIDHKILADGSLSTDDTVEEGRAGVVRELEVDLIMTRSTAVALRNWLEKRLQDFEDYQVEIERVTSSN